MSNNNITKFLRLKEVKVTNVENHKDYTIISMRMKKPKPNRCPHCGHTHLQYHDRRIGHLRDVPYNHKPVFFALERTRCLFPHCKKKTEKKPDFLMKKSQITKRLFFWILEEFRKIRSVNDIAKECGFSTTSIFRYLDKIKPKRRKLSEVLCIDEFKGDSGGIKYQVNLADGKNHEIIDILPSRYTTNLYPYFQQISKEERRRVKYFVSDMSKVFKDIHDTFFPHSIHVIDKYHYIRQISWGLENVRKREEKSMSYTERLFFKRSKSLLQKPMSYLKDSEKGNVADMLEKNESIRQAYFLKEVFYQNILTKTNKEDARKALNYWIKEAETYGDKEWKPCIRALKNWKEDILNTFECSWTNGFVEGSHNRIKTIKRVSFGMPNFNHFRTRILFVLG